MRLINERYGFGRLFAGTPDDLQDEDEEPGQGSATAEAVDETNAQESEGTSEDESEVTSEDESEETE